MLDIQVHRDVALIIHRGVCNFENAHRHVEQVQAAIHAMIPAHERVAIISVVYAESIDRVYQKSMTDLVHTLSPLRTFHITVLESPAYRVMVRLASLAVGVNVVICGSTAEAVDQALKSGFQPNPAWE